MMTAAARGQPTASALSSRAETRWQRNTRPGASPAFALQPHKELIMVRKYKNYRVF